MIAQLLQRKISFSYSEAKKIISTFAGAFKRIWDKKR
jgi:hypothetical protein